MAQVTCMKRGNYWQYRFEGAKIGGKRKRFTKGGFATKKEAMQAGTKALAEYNNSGLAFIPSEISFSDYRFLDERILQNQFEGGHMRRISKTHQKSHSTGFGTLQAEVVVTGGNTIIPQ